MSPTRQPADVPAVHPPNLTPVPACYCLYVRPLQVEQLKKDVDTKKAQLEQWCKTAFGEVCVGGGGKGGGGSSMLQK